MRAVDTAVLETTYPSAALTWTAVAVLTAGANGGANKVTLTAYAYCA